MGYLKHFEGITLKRCWLKFSHHWLYSKQKNVLTNLKTLFLMVFMFILIILWARKSFYLSKNNPISDFNSACFCNGENFCFPGINENGTTKHGKRFDCYLYDGLKSNNLLDSDAIKTPLDYKKLNDTWQPVFLTIVTKNTFKNIRKMVSTIHQFYPHSKIIIFNLGLKKPESIRELKEWCNVEYRRLNYNKYPVHVKHLINYTYQMVIIETFKDYKTFFYFDHTVQVTGRNLAYFLQGVKQKDLLPFSFHTKLNHSVFSATHKNMFEYMPLPLIVSQMYQIQTSFMFVSDSPYTRYIMKWWYLCAMTKECIAPKDANLNCNYHKFRNFQNKKRTYTNCHRFDQAYWNIAALAHLFGEKRCALELGYVDKNWTHLTDNLVAQIEEARLSSMQPFFSIADIKNRDVMTQRLLLCLK